MQLVRRHVLPVAALLIASPNLNGRVERIIQNIKRECLGKFILFGRRHLDHVITEWVEYDNSRFAAPLYLVIARGDLA